MPDWTGTGWKWRRKYFWRWPDALMEKLVSWNQTCCIVFYILGLIDKQETAGIGTVQRFVWLGLTGAMRTTQTAAFQNLLDLPCLHLVVIGEVKMPQCKMEKYDIHFTVKKINCDDYAKHSFRENSRSISGQR